MPTRFVPKNFTAPQKVNLGDYYLVPITAANAKEDWDVLNANAETITQLRGGGSTNAWPVLPFDENYKELAWLEICARHNQLFCYILRNKADNSYAGCVYIYPIDLFYPKKAEKYDVDFSCWITKQEYDQGKYEEVFNKLYDWLSRDWPFARERIFLRNNEIPTIRKPA